MRHAGLVLFLLAQVLPTSAGAAPEPAAATAPPGQVDARPGAGGKPSQGLPPELRKLFDREAAPLPTRPVALAGGVTGQVEASAAPSLADEGKELTVPIGTQQPVQCQLYAERLDVGSSTVGALEAIKKTLNVLMIRPVAVVAAAGSAVVFSELVYRQDTPKGGLLGQLKLAIFAHESHSLVCQHDEPGYSATFQRVVRGLAESLQGGAEDEREGARWAEISLVQVGDVPVGFTEHLVWDRKGGGRISTTHGANLLPRSATALVGTDTFTEEALDEAGLVDSGTYVHVANGEVDLKIRLERQEAPATFTYKGQKDGKALEGTFQAAGGLASDLWFARQLAKGAKPSKGELRHAGYSFEASPVAPLEVVFKDDPARPRGATMTIGPLTLSGTLDEHGLFEKGSLPIGPTAMKLERLWSRGTP